MSISFAGLIVAGVLLALGWLLGSPLIVGLFLALPFGATAIGTVGGSTPVVATIFELMLIVVYLGRPEYIKRLLSLFATSAIAWVALALAIYVAVGAVVIPRLLAGQVPVIGDVSGYSILVPITPVPGNFNQSMYFTFGIAVFFVLRLALFDERFFKVIFLGFMAAAAMHTFLGLLDYGAKLAGMTDILKPIRTAAYVMHTTTSVGRFWRIAGGGSEASSFATEAIAYFAFTLTYWRASGSKWALAIAAPLFVLLILSTSTTAYVALCLLSLPMLATIASDLMQDRLRRRDALILGGLAFGGISIAVINFVVPSLFSSFFDLLADSVLNKSGSDSANERSLWNTSSMNAFFMTNGLGIGIGSSRASSWLVAVVSQFGVVGSVLMLAMVWIVIFGVGRVGPPGRAQMTPDQQRLLNWAQAIQAGAIGGLVARSLVGSLADPGLIFMASVAFLHAAKLRLAAQPVRPVAFGQRAANAPEFGDPYAAR